MKSDLDLNRRLQPVIRVTNVGKIFRLYRRPLDRIKETLSLRRRVYHTRFTALDRINLTVSTGETVGLIGQNGSGKSTLLKIMSRLMLPTSGTVQVDGRIASLIELGTGFHPEFTGRANVFMVGSLMGFSTAEIRAMLPGILEFSGLADFIDRPIKTYSSGMWVRLAFSVAISVDPALLLVDEALAVGDMLFQQKCISRLREFQKRGTAIVFVSHDLGAVKTLCSRAVLLESGRTVHEGSPEDVCSLYVSLMADKANREKLETRVRGVHRRYGNYRAEITGVRVENAKGELTEALISGETCAMEVEVRVTGQVDDPSVGFLIRDRLGNDIFGTNTCLNAVRIGDDLQHFSVRFACEMDLGPGNYYVSAAVHSGRDHLEDCYDWIDNAAAFTVLPSEPHFAGCARLEPRISVQPLGTRCSPECCHAAPLN